MARSASASTGPDRYGSRWFGDFRNAVPGQQHAFCIDFRFWYASRAYRYRRDAAALHNRDGAPVTAVRQQKLSYAIWEYGRSTKPRRQAAVMLYVHSLMGDARPGEVDAAALGPAVASLFRKIDRSANRYHGPYRLDTRLADDLVVGQPATATVRLLSARGYALPHIRLTLQLRGADGPAREVETNGAGLARLALTPSAVDVQLRVVTAPVAANRPAVFVPTRGAAVANGQRLAAPASQRRSVTVLRRARPLLTTAVSQQLVRPGARIFDQIRVHGLGRTTARVGVELYGPFAARTKISCAGRPYWRGELTARGESRLRSPPLKVARAGFYAYRERLIDSRFAAGSTTECAAADSTMLVAPRIVAGRGDVSDSVRASGAGTRTPIHVRIPSLRISAPVTPAGIDVAHGVLGLPTGIRRTGWWKDGMAPGATSGAILIAGHVDSARGGTGVFFELRRARPGDRVQLATTDGGTYTYRVVSVRSYRKTALPTSIYSSKGAPRLVLATCGGPFDQASGHYRDNVVLTAVPV